MTNRKNRSRHETNLLKAILLTSTIAATLLGTRLLASKEEQTIDTNQATAPLIIENESSIQLLNPPDGTVIIDLQPVPQAYTPELRSVQQVQPVARTHSS